MATLTFYLGVRDADRYNEICAHAEDTSPEDAAEAHGITVGQVKKIIRRMATTAGYDIYMERPNEARRHIAKVITRKSGEMAMVAASRRLNGLFANLSLPDWKFTAEATNGRSVTLTLPQLRTMARSV